MKVFNITLAILGFSGPTVFSIQDYLIIVQSILYIYNSKNRMKAPRERFELSAIWFEISGSSCPQRPLCPLTLLPYG